MIDPLLFYRQIAALNQRALDALAAGDLETALAAVTERHAWQRTENTPDPASEAALRTELIPLMEELIAQDIAIGQGLEAAQAKLGDELRTAHRARVSQEYNPAGPHPDPKFMDQAG